MLPSGQLANAKIPTLDNDRHIYSRDATPLWNQLFAIARLQCDPNGVQYKDGCIPKRTARRWLTRTFNDGSSTSHHPWLPRPRRRCTPG